MNSKKNFNLQQHYLTISYGELVTAFNSSVGGQDVTVNERLVLDLIMAVRTTHEELKYSLFTHTPDLFIELFGEQEYRDLVVLHEQYVAIKLPNSSDFAAWVEVENEVINE